MCSVAEYPFWLNAKLPNSDRIADFTIPEQDIQDRNDKAIESIRSLEALHIPMISFNHRLQSLLIPSYLLQKRLDLVFEVRLVLKCSSNSLIMTELHNKPDSYKLGSDDLEARPTTPSSGPVTAPLQELQEGGRNGWLAVMGCWSMMFITYGYINAFGYAL